MNVLRHVHEHERVPAAQAGHHRVHPAGLHGPELHLRDGAAGQVHTHPVNGPHVHQREHEVGVEPRLAVRADNEDEEVQALHVSKSYHGHNDRPQEARVRVLERLRDDAHAGTAEHGHVPAAYKSFNGGRDPVLVVVHLRGLVRV
ncbi:hypothetical protein BGW36DRAFT_386522 [Talaromyces proteolyticus]|uniref:Uncharacterized protein n=1 Tax=Talaromyces proteolyticus TaxID=1131652 RepID=A0AAD4PU55_9EURO|nr:uncharacterized protein BGW36DRAFT_386522 [Talaromyces proteolyticus]KAH8691870.1 hypothetical protein BGW36DRAFT_386522 [Talaromyces proteolyticus]